MSSQPSSSGSASDANTVRPYSSYSGYAAMYSSSVIPSWGSGGVVPGLMVMPPSSRADSDVST